MIPQCSAGMAGVRENGDFTDFAIICEEEIINVHRVVISGKSSVFYRACLSKFSEATSRTYKIDDYPLAAVRRMVEYMYTGDYSDPDEGTTDEDDANKLPVLFVHTALASLADKYDIEGLMALVTEKYAKALKDDPDVAKFLDSVPEIYSMPAEPSQPLRDAAVDFARREARTAIDSWMGWAKFGEILDSFPQFSKELLCSLIWRPLRVSPEFCERCRGWDNLCIECGTGGSAGE
ncbi:hypothetical protein N0V84_001497 [Fusarium piperis]|uniref:BTB domain-containing protein n=1 Tax=Fusarium piperis TaxID=1435070 RepID=A0A9W8WL38_9HYPO|nr:hypothetical protein N0V84_001497 [Fusarium piperis]